MDTQGLYDELEAELLAANPNRAYVIRDLKALLEAIEDGGELPVPCTEE